MIQPYTVESLPLTEPSLRFFRTSLFTAFFPSQPIHRYHFSVRPASALQPPSLLRPLAEALQKQEWERDDGMAARFKARAWA